MSRIKRKALLFVLAAAMIYVACRKVEQSAQGTEAYYTTAFFDYHPPANPLIQEVAEYMKAENKRYGFAESTIKKIGYPFWDKGLVIQGPSDTTHLVFIPFARDKEHFVNAILAVSVRPSGFSYRVLSDWQYKDSALTGLSPKNFALTMMQMDNRVFENKTYRVLDKKLFGDKVSYVSLDAINNNAGISSASRQIIPGVLYTYEVCHTEFVDTHHGQVHGCPPGDPHCNDYTEVLICDNIPYTIDEGGTGGTGMPGPTGGPLGGGNGNSGGGGNGGGTGGGGWSPIGSIPPAVEPVDSMLAKYSRAINNTSDSIFSLSMANQEEWGHILVERNNSIYAKNCTTAHKPGYVRQDRTITAQEKIVGELHIHPDSSSNPLERDGPSGDDLSGLRYNTRDRYTLFVDCGDERFALVIENVDSARAFFNTHSLSQLVALHDSIPITITSPSWVTNWRNATKQSIRQILGSSVTCGIGFYISTDTRKTIYSKLNP